jgi:fucose 4-O-acetylase-like acetyltransferase
MTQNEVKLPVLNREIWVDICKGIGIILVVIGHAERGLYSAGFEADSYSVTTLDNLIYSFHMPLFFILSGLFIEKSKLNLQGLFVRRFWGIFYPYLVWSLMQGFIEVQASSYKNETTSMESVLNLLWQPRAQFWFLYVLFFSSLFFSAMRSMRVKTSWFCLTCFFLALFSEIIAGKLWVLNKVIYYSFFLSLGAYMGSSSTSWFSSKVSQNIFALLGLLVTVMGVFMVLPYVSRMEKTFFSVIIALSGSLAVIAFSQRIMSSHFLFCVRGLSILGKNSMEIYLMHIIWLGFARLIWNVLIKNHNFFVALPYIVFAGVIGPLVSAWVIERTGMQKFLFGFRSK